MAREGGDKRACEPVRVSRLGRWFSFSLSISFSEKLLSEEDEAIDIGGDPRAREGLSE